MSEFYPRDPQFAAVKGWAESDQLRPLHPALQDDYDAEYQQHFFTRHVLIDKVSTIGRMQEGNVYCNFYRMHGAAPYSQAEQKLFARVLPVMTTLIGAHYRLVSPMRQPGTGDARMMGD